MLGLSMHFLCGCVLYQKSSTINSYFLDLSKAVDIVDRSVLTHGSDFWLVCHATLV